MGGRKRPAIRRYFFDTEFNDKIGQFACDFISIGIVAEDGREYYGISNEFNVAAAKERPWLKENVIDKLDDPSTWVSVDEIRQRVLAMIEPADVVEFWADNGCYDHVLLCQIFGGMGELFEVLKSKGVGRVVFRDGHELGREVPNLRLWQSPPEGEHIAINDARQGRLRYMLLSHAKGLQADMPAPHLPHVK